MLANENNKTQNMNDKSSFSELTKKMFVIPDDAYIMLDETTMVRFSEYKDIVLSIIKFKHDWPKWMKSQNAFDSKETL